MSTIMHVPIFIPHMGCPHDCVFCNQRSVTGIMAAPSPESVAFHIEKCLSGCGTRQAEIAFFGGSFTGIPLKMQTQYLKAAAPFLESGRARGIRVSTRPDMIDDNILALLKEYHVTAIELGAQSMSDEVLLKSGRGHTAADTARAAERIRAHGFVLGLQMMTGLPGSTKEDEVMTARQFVSLGAKEARIYPTVVFRKSSLYRMMQAGEYKPQSIEEAVDTAAAALEVFLEGNVQILRIGLMETETLGAEIAGGAYHPAMGEMVRARLYRNAMEQAIGKEKELFVTCPMRLWSQVVGQKRENIRYLEEKYGIYIRMEQGACFSVGGKV